MKPHLQSGLALLQQGQPAQALAYVLPLAKALPNDADTWHLLGVIHYQMGDLPQAAGALEQAMTLAPKAFDIWLNLANVLHAWGRLAEAQAAYQRCLHLNSACLQAYPPLLELLQGQPLWPSCQLNYALALQLAGHIPEAIAVYRQLMHTSPQAQAANNLGTLLYQQGQSAEAAESLQHAVVLQPDYAEAWLNLAMVTLFGLGEPQLALAQLNTALNLKPDCHGVPAQMALELYLLKRYDWAIPFFELALEKNRQPEATWLLKLGHCWERLCEPQSALRVYQQAQKYQPNAWWLDLKQATVLPLIYQDRTDLFHWRERYTQELTRLEQQWLHTPPLPQSGQAELISLTFALAYQGENDRERCEQVARLAHQVLPCQEYPVAAASEQRPLKVGFVSAFWHAHSISRCFKGVVSVIAQQSDMQVTVFQLEGARQDTQAEDLRAITDWVVLPNALEDAAALIAAQGLDVLIYIDIGLDPRSYALALNRLARWQCALSGHPVTTGLPTIDWFISCSLREGPGAEQHYCERLVLLPEIPLYYARPQPITLVKSRADWGWEANRHLYFCPGTLFKIHPDCDAVFAAILAQDPSAQLIFVADQGEWLATKLQQRLALQLPLERVQFLPWLTPDDFAQVLQLADVVLDPLHFNGSNTFYQAMMAGTPVITLPSTYLRGRLSAGFYRMMGLSELIATDSSDYVAKAIRLAGDPAERHSLQLPQRATILFDNPAGALALANWLRKTCHNA